jgi:hypothetical protein
MGFSEIYERSFLTPASPDFHLHLNFSLVVPLNFTDKLFHDIWGACRLTIAPFWVLGHWINLYREIGRPIWKRETKFELANFKMTLFKLIWYFLICIFLSAKNWTAKLLREFFFFITPYNFLWIFCFQCFGGIVLNKHIIIVDFWQIEFQTLSFYKIKITKNSGKHLIFVLLCLRITISGNVWVLGLKEDSNHISDHWMLYS